LADFKFFGAKKGEKDDLDTKTGLVKDRVLTENMKQSAVEVITKFYADKGFRNVTVKMTEEPSTILSNSVALYFYINKGEKVKIKSEELPEAVKKSLEAQEYRGWMISSAYKAGDIYEVELKNGAETKTVKFSKDGKKVE